MATSLLIVAPGEQDFITVGIPLTYLDIEKARLAGWGISFAGHYEYLFTTDTSPIRSSTGEGRVFEDDRWKPAAESKALPMPTAAERVRMLRHMLHDAERVEAAESRHG